MVQESSIPVEGLQKSRLPVFTDASECLARLPWHFCWTVRAPWHSVCERRQHKELRREKKPRPFQSGCVWGALRVPEWPFCCCLCRKRAGEGSGTKTEDREEVTNCRESTKHKGAVKVKGSRNGRQENHSQKVSGPNNHISTTSSMCGGLRTRQ